MRSLLFKLTYRIAFNKIIQGKDLHTEVGRVQTCTKRVGRVSVQSKLKGDLAVRGQGSAKPKGWEQLITERSDIIVISFSADSHSPNLPTLWLYPLPELPNYLSGLFKFLGMCTFHLYSRKRNIK